MIRKEILAVVAVAVVVVVAAVALMINNGDNDKEPTVVDTIRTDLKVGDKYETITKNTTTVPFGFSSDSTSKQFFSFFEDFTGDLIGEDKVTYKGKEIECFILGDKDNKRVYVAMDTNVEYKIELGDAVLTLVESNLDLSKGINEIELMKDGFIQ